MTSLTDRLALVTGASSGIGASTAVQLARAGARVVLVGRDRPRLEQTRSRCPGSTVIELDVRDARAVERALSPLDLDLIVNNAGLALGSDKLPEGDPEEWSTVVATNVNGVLNVMHATLPALVKKQRGDHVFLGSVAGRQVYPGGSVYCATKHAVRALYETARLDMAGSGVRFTTVDPGMVQTDFSRVRFRGDTARAAAVYQGVTPLTPDDVAEAIVWAVTRPAHVNIGEIVMWAAAQASTTVVTRRT
ncbi:MAG: SDR family NAD(P)-dependent oxidoreductase [Planctomycetes bacterium]|nr:SDR family NAD(P)-dependent oxidoreductase [Planctomycetota bacterium]